MFSDQILSFRYTWKEMSPWVYSKNLKATKYTSRNAALKACAANSKCTGLSGIKKTVSSDITLHFDTL